MEIVKRKDTCEKKKFSLTDSVKNIANTLKIYYEDNYGDERTIVNKRIDQMFDELNAPEHMRDEVHKEVLWRYNFFRDYDNTRPRGPITLTRKHFNATRDSVVERVRKEFEDDLSQGIFQHNKTLTIGMSDVNVNELDKPFKTSFTAPDGTVLIVTLSNEGINICSPGIFRSGYWSGTEFELRDEKAKVIIDDTIPFSESGIKMYKTQYKGFSVVKPNDDQENTTDNF